MKYARETWKQERNSWRSVIQLNLIRSVITIIETVQAELDGDPITHTIISPLNMNTESLLRSSLDVSESEITTSTRLAVPLTDRYKLLKVRLGPLRQIEADLKRQLGAGIEEPAGGGVGAGVIGEGRMTVLATRFREFGVRELKDALGRSKRIMAGREDDIDEATEVIASCREDIKALWMDEAVRGVLKKRKVMIEDSAGL
jgi:guanine nucleotide-binding protein alpha-1 subunit